MPLIDSTDPAPDHPAAAKPIGKLRLLLRAVVVAGTAVAVWSITHWWLHQSSIADRMAMQVVFPICVMALSVFAMIAQVRWWNEPRRKLRQLLKEIRAGHLAIESLKEVRGGMRGVADDLADLLHDYRALQRRLVEKDIEADQRVATKADAMQRIIGSLRLQAIRDPLTGLFNRRALDELLPRLIDHCTARGEDLSLLMIDVDHFKQLNDQLGHAAGDDMLRSIGQLIRSGLSRRQDAAFRCGGDEFVVVLPGAPAGPAQKLAESLTALVGNLARTIRCNPRPGLSVGIASLSSLPSPTASMLLLEADKRLYDAKQKAHRAAQAA